jgi:hypothetical protein
MGLIASPQEDIDSYGAMSGRVSPAGGFSITKS